MFPDRCEAERQKVKLPNNGFVNLSVLRISVP